eukprot:6468637-Amphidinium_carterae.1
MAQMPGSSCLCSLEQPHNQTIQLRPAHHPPHPREPKTPCAAANGNAQHRKVVNIGGNVLRESPSLRIVRTRLENSNVIQDLALPQHGWQTQV